MLEMSQTMRKMIKMSKESIKWNGANVDIAIYCKPIAKVQGKVLRKSWDTEKKKLYEVLKLNKFMAKELGCRCSKE